MCCQSALKAVCGAFGHFHASSAVYVRSQWGWRTFQKLPWEHLAAWIKSVGHLTSQQVAEHLEKAPVEHGQLEVRQVTGVWGRAQEEYEQGRRRFY